MRNQADFGCYWKHAARPFKRIGVLSPVSSHEELWRALGELDAGASREAIAPMSGSEKALILVGLARLDRLYLAPEEDIGNFLYYLKQSFSTDVHSALCAAISDSADN